MKTGVKKPVRCAIYTRVSTDAGLEQEFNSLDAQYDASQAYIRSQAHAGWTLIKARYDDGDLEQSEPRQEREFWDRRPRVEIAAFTRTETGISQGGDEKPRQ